MTTTRTTTRSVRPWRGLAILVFVAGISVTGCTSQRPPKPVAQVLAPISSPSPSVSPSPTSTLSTAQIQAEIDAMTAFNKYRAYEQKAMTSGHFDRSVMTGFIGDPLLGDSIYAFAQQESAGMTFKGTTSWAPKVVSVNLTGPEPIVKIRDCYDMTDFKPVIYGKPGPHIAGPARMDLTLKVEKVRGVWYVFYEDSTPGKTSC